MEQLPGNIEFDEFGVLKNPQNRTPELARELAKRYEIGPLTDQHWAFIRSLENYYLQYHAPPPAHRLCHDLQLQRGCEHNLFHTCLDVWRIAGLPDAGEEAKTYLSAE